jgi:putative endonuclease
MAGTYYVYILTNKYHNVLYTGVTNDLDRRILEHREGKLPGFNARYLVNKLVYYEEISDINAAIEREKQIKSGSRKKKVELVNAFNPEWIDLAEDLTS